MLDQTFAALSDPTRRSIVGLLAEEEMSVGEIVEQFSIAQSAISRHLNVLENAQLIQRERQGQRRICRLKAAPLSEIDEWMEGYRRHWKGALTRLQQAVVTEGRSSNEQPDV